MGKTKSFTNNANHKLYTLMMALLFLWCGSVSVSAQGTGTKADPYIWTDQTEGIATADGAQFAATGYQIYAAFTPETDGILVFSCLYSQFTDNTFATLSETQPKWNGVYPQQCKLNCTAGNTYYVGGNASSSSVTVKYLAEAEPLKLTECSPEAGKVFDTVIGTVNLSFNQKVSIERCIMEYGNKTANPAVNVNNAYASVSVKDELMAAYNNGSLKEGDDIKFTFSGIKATEDNSLLDGTGIYEVTYKAGAKPLMLVSTTNTPNSETPVNDFKSYYMSSDATGVVRLTFDGNIGNVRNAVLQYGSQEPVAGDNEDDDPKEEFYQETLNPLFDGNTIVINLKNKLRRPKDMLPDATTVYPTMALVINGVTDTNGNNVYSGGKGTIGSFVYNFNYKNIEYTPSPDWAVVDGEAITADTKNVELWLSESGDKATFTGVKFAYKENGADKTATVKADELTIESDPADNTARIITIPVPNVNMDKGTVTVSLDGVETPSGVVPETFSNEFTCDGRTAAAANELAVTSAILHAASGDVEMVNGSIGTIASKATATITLNKEVGFMKWEVSEPELGILKNSYGTPNSSSFDVTFRGAELKCLAGKTYTFTLKAWNTEAESYGNAAPTIGTATFTFAGTESAYVYSDVVLQSHINDPYLLMNSEETTYTLEFSAPATVKKVVLNQGGGFSANCEYNAVEGTDDRTWIVNIPAEALSESQILINVFAEDKEHRAINKALDYTCPTDGGDNVWLPIVLEAEFNKPAFTVEPASESVLDKIDVITFSHAKPINPSYAISEKIKIMTSNGRVTLYELGFNDVKRPEGYEGTDKLCIVLDNPITEAGNYIIDVPSGFFNIGEEFEGASSRATTICYEVKAATGIEVKVTPESESVVESLDKIVFTYEPGINVNWGESEGDKITVYNKETRTEMASFTKEDVKFPDDFFDVTNVRVEFAEPITAAGIYEVTVPAGFFALGESGDDVNETMVIYYEVKAKSEPTNNLEVTFDPAGGNVTEIPASIKLTVNNRSEIGPNGINPTLTDDANNSYSVSIDLNWDWEWNCLEIKLADGAITAKGTYTLTIPAGAIIGKDETDTNTEDIVVIYVIGTGTGIDNIVANAGGKVDVYTVNGANVLRNADAAAVKALAKGLYIINGKKVVIK